MARQWKPLPICIWPYCCWYIAGAQGTTYPLNGLRNLNFKYYLKKIFPQEKYTHLGTMFWYQSISWGWIKLRPKVRIWNWTRHYSGFFLKKWEEIIILSLKQVWEENKNSCHFCKTTGRADFWFHNRESPQHLVVMDHFEVIKLYDWVIIHQSNCIQLSPHWDSCVLLSGTCLVWRYAKSFWSSTTLFRRSNLLSNYTFNMSF